MKLKNHTNLTKAERFILEKLKQYDTSKLNLSLKYGKRGRYYGYCRYSDFKVVCFINPNKDYPFIVSDVIGTEKYNIVSKNQYMWRYVEDEEIVFNLDEMMVYITGHEIWHYLCKTKQEKGNFQTKANAFGFRWLREFKQRR